MGPSRPCRKRRIEIQIESRIHREPIPGHLQHVNMMIPLEVHFPKVVLIEEVVADHQPLIVVGDSATRPGVPPV